MRASFCSRLFMATAWNSLLNKILSLNRPCYLVQNVVIPQMTQIVFEVIIVRETLPYLRLSVFSAGVAGFVPYIWGLFAELLSV